MLAVTVAAALPLVAACEHSAAGSDASPDAIDAGSRLDLATARFEQIATGDVALELTTHGPWEPADVKPSATRALCVWLRNELSPTASGRLCVVPKASAKSGVRLRYTTLDHRRRRTGIREVSATVRRPAPTTVVAHVEPTSLDLVPGRYRWLVRSRSRHVDDRLPDAGERPLEVALHAAPAAQETCFAAAARDPRRRCENPGLRKAVVPAPEDAVLTTNSPCALLPRQGRLRPCTFGVPAVDARATVALVGDSHAAQWRGALEQVAQHKRWHGISITRSGCTLSRVTPALKPRSRRTGCMRWNAQLPRWLRRHRNIRTLFVSQHPAEVILPPGASPHEARVAGHLAAWKALPRSVRRIVVLRDTPQLGYRNVCVRRARAHNRNAGDVCALPRAQALKPDPAVDAARRLRSRRVKVVDLTPFFCSARRCMPVIGGALVYKDREHMTDVFSTSLGPYLLRALPRSVAPRG